MRLVRNHCIDLLRRRRAEPLEADALPATGPGPEASAEAAQRDLARELEQARESLAKGVRGDVAWREERRRSARRAADPFGRHPSRLFPGP